MHAQVLVRHTSPAMDPHSILFIEKPRTKGTPDSAQVRDEAAREHRGLGMRPGRQQLTPTGSLALVLRWLSVVIVVDGQLRGEGSCLRTPQ